MQLARSMAAWCRRTGATLPHLPGMRLLLGRLVCKGGFAGVLVEASVVWVVSNGGSLQAHQFTAAAAAVSGAAAGAGTVVCFMGGVTFAIKVYHSS